MDGGQLSSTYPEYKNQIENIKEVPEEKPEKISSSSVLPKYISDKLDIDLYSHQKQSIEYLLKGEDICVSTGTSSGKTLVYGLFIAYLFLEDRDSRSILIYPTKALSRDQKLELEDLYKKLGLDIDIGVYDGDISSRKKRKVREKCNVVISNFSGLNQYLPHHSGWNNIFSNLDLVVVDESHTYTGIEGMHVAWILRRLLRISESDRYSSNPQIVFSSATIGNPREHSRSLSGRDVEVIDKDGSPSGRREIVFWNPPRYIDDEGIEERRSSHRESSEILAHLTHYGDQTLMFASSRKMTELNSKWCKEILEKDYNDNETVIEPYNAGYTKKERRRVEERFRSGHIDGVVSTPALEVGINIGSIDASILSGYPGSRVSFWQQIGRSGRETKDALSVLVAMNNSIDQFIMRNPEYLFENQIEDAVVDLDNNQVFSQHVLVASREMPLTRDDTDYFDERIKKVANIFRKRNEMTGNIDVGLRYNGGGRPEGEIDIYSTGKERFDVIIKKDGRRKTLPSIDKNRAYRDFHPGSVYLHKGKYYMVEEFKEKTENPRVLLEPTDVDYYTETLRQVEIDDLEEKDSKEIKDFQIKCGTGRVKEYYTQYNKKRISNDNVIETSYTGLSDPVELYTHILWMEMPIELEQKINNKYDTNSSFIGGIHAVEHAMINMTPIELMVDPKDLGGLSTNQHRQTTKPTMFIYDGVEGGVGFSHSIYDKFLDLKQKTQKLIKQCRCKEVSGCPSCVMDYMCGDNNKPLHTSAAIDILKKLEN